MKILLGVGAAVAGALCLPAVALLAVVAVGGAALACPTAAGLGVDAKLAISAPVPDWARAWTALTHTACPDLPIPWIAAVMAQESSFHPTAWADDRNGGTRGLFQLNASVWRAAYGAGWDADLDHNRVPDSYDPEIDAATAGRYLCRRLDGVRHLREAHPDWPVFGQRSDLDALVIAHNAGEAWLPRYPTLPDVTEGFLRDVAQHVTDWSEPAAGATLRSVAGGAADGCPPAVTTGAPPSITGVVAGDPGEVAAAVNRAQVLARDRTGWLHWCDRLVCRAYGYANSGYESAIAHWTALRAEGLAHPRDRCPPAGAFLFWTTGGPYGHAALVTPGLVHS